MTNGSYWTRGQEVCFWLAAICLTCTILIVPVAIAIELWSTK